MSDVKNGIAVHANTTEHDIDWTSARGIGREGNYMKRKVKEAIYTRQEKNSRNLDGGLRIHPTWHTVT